MSEEQMTIELTTVGEVPVEGTYYKGLIFGKSGAGKTHLGATSPSPVIGLVESQGFQTIRTSNPDAMVVGSKGAKGNPCIRNMAELRQLIGLAVSGALGAAGRETLVIDSITEVQQMMMDEIMSKKTKNKGEMSMRDWGTLASKMRGLLRMLRDLPMNVIVIALCDWQEDEETGFRSLSPLVKGRSTSKELNGFFNFVGYAYKRRTENGVEHFVMTEGDEKYLVKPFAGLNGVVTPNVGDWFAYLNGDESRNPNLPNAPLPGGSGAKSATTSMSFSDEDDD
jgi:pyocin large subunit-like protein